MRHMVQRRGRQKTSQVLEYHSIIGSARLAPRLRPLGRTNNVAYHILGMFQVDLVDTLTGLFSWA